MLGCEVVIKKIYRHLKSKQKNIHKNLEQKKYAEAEKYLLNALVIRIKTKDEAIKIWNEAVEALSRKI